VYLAPDEHHLTLEPGGTLALSSEPPLTGFRPSATLLFRSVAQVCGAGVLAVVLTGMGRDGVDGLGAVRRAGGRIVVQDEASSIVYGMPLAAVEAGLADQVLSLNQLGTFLQRVDPTEDV
jgi:two-component system chemotaxis response regulator CheB